jgi:hypothetical protein
VGSRKQMVDVYSRQANRLRFLNELYERVGGMRQRYEPFFDFAAELGIDGTEAVDIIQYLASERLIETTSAAVALSHWGIKEVEQARTRPNEPTEHFPAAVNIINVQSMVGSVIQQAGHGSPQSAQLQQNDLDAVAAFVAEVRNNLNQLSLSVDRLQELESDIAALESQLSSVRPKSAIIREALKSVRNILEGAAGSVMAAALLAKFPQLAALWS